MTPPHNPTNPTNPTKLTHLLSDDPLPYGKLTLFTTDYQEFACSKATVVRLQIYGMKLNGKPVQLKVVDDYGPNVMVHYEFIH